MIILLSSISFFWFFYIFYFPQEVSLEQNLVFYLSRNYEGFPEKFSIDAKTCGSVREKFLEIFNGKVKNAESEEEVTKKFGDYFDVLAAIDR